MSVLCLLGAPRAVQDGVSTDLTPSRPALLLLYLLLRGEWVTREALAAQLFPDVPPAQARTNLRVVLSRALALPWAAGVEVERLRVRFRVDTDLQQFRAAVREGRYGDALGLYRPLLDGFALEGAPELTDAFEEERRAMQALYVQAMRRQAEHLQARGDTRGALHLLERTLAAEPWSEEALQSALALCLTLRDRERGLGLYARFRDALRAELDVDPLPQTEALMRELGRPAQASALPTLPDALRSGGHFIGREAELARLARALPGWVTLGGEAGMGKTALLRRALPGATFLTCQPGLQQVPYHPLVAALRAQPPPPLGPYDEDLARLLPDLYPDSLPAPFDPQVGKLRLLEALTRALVPAGGPLVVDDLQWADPGTLEWLTFLQGRPEVSVVLAYRSEERHPEVTRLLAGLRGRATSLNLPPLDAGTLAQWLSQLTGQGTPDTFAAWLQRHSGGHPLYALETLRSLFESGVLRADQAGWHTAFDATTRDYEELPPPPSLRALIGERSARLSTLAQQVLWTLSLHPTAPPDLLGAALQVPEWEVLGALEDLEAAAFLRAGRFAHDLLRQTVALGIPEARRRPLHRRLAGHLAGQPPGTVEASVLAWHWQQAGEPERAWPARFQHALHLAESAAYDLAAQAWGALLGELPPGHVLEGPTRVKLGRTLFWHDMPEGERQLQAALDLIEWGHSGPADLLKVEALLGLAEITLYQGRGERAEALLDEAMTLAAPLADLPEPLRRALVEQRVEVGFRRGQYARTRALLRAQPRPWPLLQTLAALGEFFVGNFRGCARAMTQLLHQHPELAYLNAMEADIGLCHLMLGDLHAAREVLLAGLGHADRPPHMQALMLTHLGLLTLLDGDPQGADETLQRAQALSQELGSATYLADVLHRRSAAQHACGQLTTALTLAAEAHRQIMLAQDPYRVVYVTAGYAALLAQAGDVTGAQALLDGLNLQPDTPPQGLSAYHHARAQVADQRGETGAAARHVAQVEALQRQYGPMPLGGWPAQRGASLPS